jgi:hypothetical protein
MNTDPISVDAQTEAQIQAMPLAKALKGAQRENFLENARMHHLVTSHPLTAELTARQAAFAESGSRADHKAVEVAARAWKRAIEPLLDRSKLGGPFIDALRVALDSIPPERYLTCPNCKGSGTEPDGNDCVMCSGHGWFGLVSPDTCA